jgi:hypothetical protein
VVYLDESIPQVDEYLKAILHMAFDVRHFVCAKMKEGNNNERE